MPKYIVVCDYNASVQVEVEAEDEEGAVEKGSEMVEALSDADFIKRAVIEHTETWVAEEVKV